MRHTCSTTTSLRPAAPFGLGFAALQQQVHLLHQSQRESLCHSNKFKYFYLEHGRRGKQLPYMVNNYHIGW